MTSNTLQWYNNRAINRESINNILVELYTFSEHISMLGIQYIHPGNVYDFHISCIGLVLAITKYVLLWKHSLYIWLFDGAIPSDATNKVRTFSHPNALKLTP